MSEKHVILSPEEVEQLRELAQEINAVAEDIERMRGAMQQTLKKIQGARDGP